GFRSGRRLGPTRGLVASLFLAGLVMLTLTLLWPKHFYPLVWGAVFLILEPINIVLGRRHFFESLSRGDWRPVVSLSLGALICGFFWEMWNFYSYPKWIYHTPGAQFLHVFEMPLLGYLGYLPFALALFVLRNLLWRGGPRVDHIFSCTRGGDFGGSPLLNNTAKEKNHKGQSSNRK